MIILSSYIEGVGTFQYCMLYIWNMDYIMHLLHLTYAILEHCPLHYAIYVNVIWQYGLIVL